MSKTGISIYKYLIILILNFNEWIKFNRESVGKLSINNVRPIASN